MSMIPFICLLVVSATLGILNTIFNNLNGWKGIVVRGLLIVSLLVFSVVVSNLEGITNAFPMFITLALAVLLLAEAVHVSMNEEDKWKPIVNGVFFAISNVLFALSVMSLAEFSVLALVGGILAGVGVGLICSAPKKNKGLNHILMNILTFACVGLLVGLGVNAVMSSKHLISAVCMAVGGVLMLIHRAIVVCGHGKTAGCVAKALMSLALIALTISIYFY